MVLIGMLHHRKDPETVKKTYAYASVAKAEGAELLYFTPKSVDIDKKIINGYIYNSGKWEKVKSRYPDVIYNAGSPYKLNRSLNIVEKLRKEIPFTSHAIGNKMLVYKRLMEDGEFSKYLIPSEIIYSFNHFMKFLYEYKKIVFKPVNGHKGQGIIFVEMINDIYHIQKENKNFAFSYNKLLEFITEKIKEELYMVQPYINCKTKNGFSYDFRLHVQKNKEGKWVITAIYPRIGPEGSIVSNINNGGSTNYLMPFLKQEFKNEYYDIKRYLEYFALQLAKKMDEIQYKTFNETIDEIGIDVGLDEKRKISIYEVNWRPGCPPAFYLELDVVKNMIQYAIFLSKNKRRG